MRTHDVVVLAGDGADDDETETARVDGMAGLDDGGERFENGFCVVERLVCVLAQEVLASGEDGVIRDDGLRVCDTLADDGDGLIGEGLGKRVGCIEEDGVERQDRRFVEVARKYARLDQSGCGFLGQVANECTQ